MECKCPLVTVCVFPGKILKNCVKLLHLKTEGITFAGKYEKEHKQHK
jgi:hypothetical protein